MSNQEEHPLDAQLRRALALMEVEPPRRVWQGVQRGIHARSGGMAWWGRRLPWLLLLLPLATLSVLLKGPAHPTGSAPMGQDIHERNETTTMAGTPDSDVIPTRSVEQTAMAQVLAIGETTTLAERSTNTLEPDRGIGLTMEVDHDPAAVPPHASNGPGRTATTVQRQGYTPPAPHASYLPDTTDANRVDAIAANTLVHGNEAAPARPMGRGISAGRLGNDPRPDERLSVRHPGLESTLPPERTPKGGVWPEYVLPKGEWWMAATVGRYDVTRRWTGSDDGLARALQATEAPAPTLGLGLSVGHERRSGWSLSAGLFLERSEQHFRHVDRRVNVDAEVVTYLVTLNTQVFVSDVDTLLTITTEETTTTGVNRMHITRLPLQVHWRGQRGRWSMGAHAGLALEWTRVQNGLSLLRDASDGRPVAAPVQSSELRRRYPMQVIALAGAEAGFMLHERWHLHAGPVYQLGHALGKAPVQATASRWGLQVRLAHHFPQRTP